jgi:hypothetical protein
LKELFLFEFLNDLILEREVSESTPPVIISLLPIRVKVLQQILISLSLTDRYFSGRMFARKLIYSKINSGQFPWMNN